NTKSSVSTVDLSDIKPDIFNESLIDFLPIKKYRSYSEYLKEVEKRKQLLKQFKQPDLILPNSKFLDDLFKNGKLHGKTWEECMKGWYNFYCPPLPFVLNPKSKKYEYVGMDLRFKKTELDIKDIKNSSESVYENEINLESIIGKDELDDIFNNSKTSLFNSYDKLKRKQKKATKKKEKHKKKAKHKSKKGTKHKEEDHKHSGTKVKNQIKSKDTSQSVKSSFQSGSFGSFKLKSFGSNEKSNLRRNFGFDSLFDGDLNDDEITDAIFNTFLDDDDIDGDKIAEEISHLNISDDKKKAILDKFNEKLLTNILLGDQIIKKENIIGENLMNNSHHLFSNAFDPLEDSLYKMSSTKGIPISEELIKENKKMVDNYLANGGNLKSLRMNEDGEIEIDEENNDLNKLYKTKSRIDNSDPNAYNALKEISGNRRKSSDIAWNIIRQWKTDKKIDFKYIKKTPDRRKSSILSSNIEGYPNISIANCDENNSPNSPNNYVNYGDEKLLCVNEEDLTKRRGSMLNVRRSSRIYSRSRDDFFNQKNNNNINIGIGGSYNHLNNLDFTNIKNNNFNNSNYYFFSNDNNSSIYDNSYNSVNHDNFGDHDNYDEENVNEVSIDGNEVKEKTIQNKRSDLHQIIVNLMRITKNGLWSEKCEASKALLFLYNEFHSDLKISSSYFLLNQIDLFNDDSWKVRAQMCANLIGYNCYNKECLKKVVMLLKDCSNEELLEQKSNEHKKEEKAGMEKILYWIRKVDPNTHSKIFRRMPSYFQHLVSPYDNREVKLNLTDESVNNQQKSEPPTENNQNNANTQVHSEMNESNIEQKNDNSNINLNSVNFSNPNSTYFITDSNLNIDDSIIMDSNFLSMDYSNREYSFTNQKSNTNSLIPLENKSIYNVVENSDSKVFLSKSSDMIYNEDIYELSSRINSNFIVEKEGKEEKEDKEVLKMPPMDLPPSSLINQQQKSQKSNSIISLPSVT
ncbi:hypothetical protein PIROE2DRAFT_2429, partial [Piromyces sp. E2]